MNPNIPKPLQVQVKALIPEALVPEQLVVQTACSASLGVVEPTILHDDPDVTLALARIEEFVGNGRYSGQGVDFKADSFIEHIIYLGFDRSGLDDLDEPSIQEAIVENMMERIELEDLSEQVRPGPITQIADRGMGGYGVDLPYGLDKKADYPLLEGIRAAFSKYDQETLSFVVGVRMDLPFGGVFDHQSVAHGLDPATYRAECLYHAEWLFKNEPVELCVHATNLIEVQDGDFKSLPD